MDIEQQLFPNSGKLIIDEDEEHSAIIVDAELDPLHCTFNYDDCIQIDVGQYSYITLSKETLYQMIALIEESQNIFDTNSLNKNK